MKSANQSFAFISFEDTMQGTVKRTLDPPNRNTSDPVPSVPMRCLYSQVRVAATNSDHPILITGEVGVGKSHLARFIHSISPRADHPLVFIDCGSFGDLDNVLYEHCAGAFTGATWSNAGRLRAAHGGTMVLDDVDRLSLHQQDQLHRVLVDGTYHVMGDSRASQVDIRFLATTNKDPEAEVEAGRIKMDFLSRLDYFRFRVPPLRERPEDVPLLLGDLIERHRRKQLDALGPVEFHHDCWVLLKALDFSDNIRGLDKLAVRLLANLGERGLVTPVDIEAVLQERLPSSSRSSPVGATLSAVVESAEREHILRICHQTNFNLRQTARILGITPKTLYAKLRNFGIVRP